jgi:Na+-translocating ferredoxin:NAD+ oxidoreductase RnfE subunit
MTFGMYYILGIMVVTWLIVIENLVLSSYSKLAKQAEVSTAIFWLISIAMSFLCALVWPLFVIWDAICVINKIRDSKKQ